VKKKKYTQAIANWPLEERPREKLIIKGPELLTADEDLQDRIRRHPLLEPKQRAHSPLLAAGLASELKIDTIPYGRRFPVACCGDLQWKAVNVKAYNTFKYFDAQG
jgi:hypothetical protein